MLEDSVKKMAILKKIISAAVISALAASAVPAQEIPTRDSVVFRLMPTVDSSLVGKSIFEVLPSRTKGDKADVTVHQTESVTEKVDEFARKGGEKQLSGYRVRIFFDNRQSSRGESEEILRSFLGKYHGIPAYRTYQNPFFKVTVGDFRTKSEAIELLRRIRSDFPAAFIVREAIEYPVLDKEHSFYADTLKVPLSIEL